MMPNFLYTTLMLLIGLGAFLFIAATAYQLLYWAACALWTLALRLIEEISRFLIRSTISFCLLLKKMSHSLLVFLYEIVATGFLWLMVPPASWLATSMKSFREYLRLRRLYMTQGRKDFASFSEFKRDWQEDGHFKTDGKEKGRTDTGAPKSDYQEALDILGLSDIEGLTLAVLKHRYRHLMTIIHPDKGFPNHVFAQQINNALETIKRERKWP